jgi:hypothetical protein
MLHLAVDSDTKLQGRRSLLGPEIKNEFKACCGCKAIGIHQWGIRSLGVCSVVLLSLRILSV